MSKQIFAIEINYNDAPRSLQEQALDTEQHVRRCLAELRSSVEEVFVLSAGNRFAVYAVNDTITPVTDFFSSDPSLKEYAQVYYNTEEAITHLFALAGGLLSDVKGERQIFSSLEEAHQLALESRSIGIKLDLLLQQALQTGKKIRTATGIDNFCQSVVDAGIELLYNRLDNLYRKQFLVIGTGKIARLALRYLYSEGIRKVVIASHDLKRAQLLAEKYNAKAIRIEELDDYFAAADVVIGGTNGEVSVSPAALADGARADEFNHPKKLIILDFGTPRNFDRRLAKHRFVELYNLEDLKRLHQSACQNSTETAWNMVAMETREFLPVMAWLDQAPVLKIHWHRFILPDECDLKSPLSGKRDIAGCDDFIFVREHAQRLVRSNLHPSPACLSLLTNNTVAEDAYAIVKAMSAPGELALELSCN